LTAAIKESGNKIIADEGSFTVVPTKTQAERLKDYVGQEVIFGIRPEDMEHTRTPQTESIITAKITIVEPLGAETHLYLNTGKHDFAARSHAETGFVIGEVENFIPNMEKSKFFDVKTEKNICEDVKSE
jgi:multiple sugar transport system ATP-binding protein